VVPTEQLTTDREVPLRSPWGAATHSLWGATTERGERAARESLRAQVTKLERELSAIVAGRFPHVSVSPAAAVTACGRRAGPAGPHLLSLAELERQRDRLVIHVRDAQCQARRRAELARRSREQLERMRAHPGSYKFVRLPVTDLGERGCGVWEVRPRLGLLGMLAGWWELKLSSGCPLPSHTLRTARSPCGASACRPTRSHARAVATRAPSRAWRRVCAPHRRRGPAPPVRSSAERDGRLLPAGGGEGTALALGERP
jgi:hypothetical protein